RKVLRAGGRDGGVPVSGVENGAVLRALGERVLCSNARVIGNEERMSMSKERNALHRIPGFTAERSLDQGASSPYAGRAHSYAGGGTVVLADTWRGTAPFCDGQCLPGEEQIGTSNCGDGGCCWTGHKVLCRNRQPTCQGTQTNTSCYGILMVC